MFSLSVDLLVIVVREWLLRGKKFLSGTTPIGAVLLPLRRWTWQSIENVVVRYHMAVMSQFSSASDRS